MPRHSSRGSNFESRIASSLGLLDRIRQHYAKRAARHQLYALEDRMLQDIGIARSDIDRVTTG
jgi:uncharacterized protein YjiS (DUF1127 family)